MRDCHIKFSQIIEDKCVYGNKPTNIGNTEKVQFTIADKSLNLYKFIN